MQDNDFSDYTDEFGQTAPLPASHGQRMPPPEDFRFGPDEGERFPDFNLKSPPEALKALQADDARHCS